MFSARCADVTWAHCKSWSNKLNETLLSPQWRQLQSLSKKKNHIQPLWLSGVQFKKHTRKHNLKQPEEKATKVTSFFFPPVRSEQFLWFQLIATFIIFQYLEFLLIKDLSHCICQFPAPQRGEKERKKRSVSKANRQWKKGQVFLFHIRVKKEEIKKKMNKDCSTAPWRWPRPTIT